MGSTYSIAKSVYRNFSDKEGNQHIAGQYGLKIILNLIHSYKVKNVLEVGVGIGTIPYLIFQAIDENIINEVSYYGTESNEFCLNALKINLESTYQKVNLFHDLDEIPEELTFDFIIIDGGDKSLEKIKKIVHKNSIILIEGYRQEQVDIIRSLFDGQFVFYDDISLEKNPMYGPFSSNQWQGGVRVFYLFPSTKQKIYCFLKRVSTSFKYKFLRKFYLIIVNKLS